MSIEKLSRFQTRACSIATGEEGLETFEKIIITLAGVAIAGGLLTWAIARSNKSTESADTKMDAIESAANALV